MVFTESSFCDPEVYVVISAFLYAVNFDNQILDTLIWNPLKTTHTSNNTHTENNILNYFSFRTLSIFFHRIV